MEMWEEYHSTKFPVSSEDAQLLGPLGKVYLYSRKLDLDVVPEIQAAGQERAGTW